MVMAAGWQRVGGRVVRVAAAAVLVAGLSGCESFRLFNDYRTAESPSVEAAPYPRLIDVPQAPPKGQFSAAVPDPATGGRIESALGVETALATERRERVAAPVLTEAERIGLVGPEDATTGKRKAQRPVVAPGERRALTQRGPAGHDAALRPVLTPEDRARLEAAVR